MKIHERQHVSLIFLIWLFVNIAIADFEIPARKGRNRFFGIYLNPYDPISRLTSTIIDTILPEQFPTTPRPKLGVTSPRPSSLPVEPTPFSTTPSILNLTQTARPSTSFSTVGTTAPTPTPAIIMMNYTQNASSTTMSFNETQSHMTPTPSTTTTEASDGSSAENISTITTSVTTSAVSSTTTTTTTTPITNTTSTTTTTSRPTIVMNQTSTTQLYLPNEHYGPNFPHSPRPNPAIEQPAQNLAISRPKPSQPSSMKPPLVLPPEQSGQNPGSPPSGQGFMTSSQHSPIFPLSVSVNFQKSHAGKPDAGHPVRTQLFYPAEAGNSYHREDLKQYPPNQKKIQPGLLNSIGRC